MSNAATVERILLVQERLEFVAIISSLRPQYLNPNLIRDTSNGGWSHPWKYFDSLRTYLLLTCFDLLGQPHSFKDFQSWLSAESAKEDRTAALQESNRETDIVEIIKVIHRKYLDAYGTKGAFHRFIRETLPRTAQQELYYSVQIREIDPATNREVGVIDTKDKKVAFLYGIRNSFTHAGINTGSPAGGVFEDHGEWVELNGRLQKGWEPIHWEKKNGLLIEYSVRDWPDVLVRTVHTGLSIASR